MRVLLLSRADAAGKPGGDLTIMRAYARHLPRFDCDVTMSSALDAPVEDFDLVHLFGLDCCLEPYVHVHRARRSPRRPALVLTPLEHRIGWTLLYHQRAMRTPLGRPENAGGARFNAYFTLRDVVRYLLSLQQRPGIGRHLPALVHSCYHRRRTVAGAMDMLCVHVAEEADAVQELFALSPLPRMVAPIGRGEPEFAPVAFDPPSDYLLSVGRIEPLKNQFAVLEAARAIGLPVLFVGHLNTRHRAYCARFLATVRASGGLARHVPHLDQKELNTLFAGARAHVLASWAEVFPLTTVEAVAAGCPIITTENSYERHAYGDAARYCDPASTDSIRDAIEAMLATPREAAVGALRARIPSWTQVMTTVAASYRSLTDTPRSG